MELRQSGLGPVGKLLSFLAAVFFVLAIVLGIFVMRGDSSGEPVDLVIPRGTSIGGVVRLLARERVIDQPTFFTFLLRITQGTSRVRAGEFRFRRNMKPISALRTLYFSDPILHTVTVPEGWTVRQIADILGAAGLADPAKFTALALSEQTARKYNLKAPTLEGFLFPDTYNFSRVDSAETIVAAMVKRFQNKFEPYRKEAELKGFTVERLVTLASIVEKETGAPQERPLIASVFLNRLKKGMRLQSDPTTIYGIPNFNGNLTRKDLETWTPYNTYRIKALPPGAIANPGEDAIRAVLRPADSDYLYFVSRNNGTHIFSKTYAEHAQHVNNFQKGWGRRSNATKN